jgi:hypothetical protein
MFHGSSPTAERMTPTTIDNSTSLASTASGGPPRKRLTKPFAMGLSVLVIHLLSFMLFDRFTALIDA